MAELRQLSNSAVPLTRAEVEALGDLFAEIYRQSGAAMMLLAERLDMIDGDPDEEEDDPAEAIGDEKDAAWIEWQTLRGSQKRGLNILATQNEDDEDDDPAEEDDHSGQSDEDGVNTGGMQSFGWGGPSGAGCPISDPGGCEHDGREHDEGGTCGHYGIDQTKTPPPPFGSIC